MRLLSMNSLYDCSPTASNSLTSKLVLYCRMGRQRCSRAPSLRQVRGDLNEPVLKPTLHVVSWLQLLHSLIERFALG